MGNPSRVAFKIIFPLILTLFICNINDMRRKSTTIFKAEGSPAESEVPVCTGNLLDQRESRYAKETKGSLRDINRLLSKTGSCRLLHYTADKIVSCLDTLHLKGNPSSANHSSDSPDDSKLHFVFMGDSRIRQQFYNFIRVI